MTEPVPVTFCEGCGARNNSATVTDNSSSVPTEGDVSICAYCGMAGVYRADQTVRPMTAREWDALDPKDSGVVAGLQLAARLLKGIP